MQATIESDIDGMADDDVVWLWCDAVAPLLRRYAESNASSDEIDDADTAGARVSRTRRINPVPLKRWVHLFQLMDGNPRRMLSVLRVFLYTATQALIRLDAATQAGDGTAIHAIARRIGRACYLIGEEDTGRYLDAVVESNERLGGHRAIPALCVANARAALTASIARATALIEVAEAGPGAEPMFLVLLGDKAAD